MTSNMKAITLQIMALEGQHSIIFRNTLLFWEMYSYKSYAYSKADCYGNKAFGGPEKGAYSEAVLKTSFDCTCTEDDR